MMMGKDVSHGVGLTGNVGDLMMIPVVMMVQAGQATEVGGSLVGGDGALAVPGDGGNIVIQGCEGEFPEIIKEGGHVCMGEDAGLLQVTVC